MQDGLYYAHTTNGDKSTWQLVKDHLLNTARIAHDLGQDAGIAELAYFAGLFHDLGKYSRAFQQRLEGAPEPVDHSTAGAYEIIRLFKQNKNQELIATLLAYCIAGHHVGLPDYGSPFDSDEDNTLKGRLSRQLEDFQAYSHEITAQDLDFPSTLSIRPIRKYPSYSLSFLVRMIYSTLVDADFLDTETFMQGGLKPRGKYPSIQELNSINNLYLQKYNNPQSEINRKRTEILNQCLASADKEPGFFSLTVPTGGGKTFSSMAFALNHAAANGLKRIIYIIPYTSIIEQNAAEFKKVFGEDNVLEHHANFDWETIRATTKDPLHEDEISSNYTRLKLAAENWDIPIVVTTNVQFFESIYANRSSSCRKVHNLAKSVLIFDEAQMLPREYLQPCLHSIVELVRNYGSTAVFCTATQPSLHKLLPDDIQVQELMSNPAELYTFFKRVHVRQAGKLNDTELTHRLQGETQVLCIVNTRRHAKYLYEHLQCDDRYHLSTLMCPVHRKKTIAEIRQRLSDTLPCRVISTQIMEAGIDVDFPIGYRAISGLDSIIQAAGRVNREGKAPSATIYLFEPVSTTIKRLPAFIQQGVDVTRMVLRKFPNDPVCISAIQTYFEELYNLQGEQAFDTKGIIDHFEKRLIEPNFDFKTAAEKFKIIEEDTKPIIIPYDKKAKTLINQLSEAKFAMQVMRKLQLYSVNIYEKEFQALDEAGAIDFHGDGFAVLNDMKYYDERTGLTLPGLSGEDARF